MLEHELYTIVGMENNAVKIRLLPESAIFSGHFPGNPITPGVCQVGIIGELAGRVCGCGLELFEVKSLKFIDLLRPSAGCVLVKFDKFEEDGGVVVIGGNPDGHSEGFHHFGVLSDSCASVQLGSGLFSDQGRRASECLRGGEPGD